MILRRRTVLAAGLVACTSLALSRLGAHTARPASVEGSIQPEAIPIVSSLGGRVERVLVKRGDHVRAGQLLLVFEASELDARLARLHHVMREVPPRFLHATASLLQRIPPSTMGWLVRSNPEILSAEQEYASALAENERQTSGAARERLKRAEGLRKQAYESAGGLRPEGLSSLHNLQAEALETLRWLEVQRARFEVRAPVEGEMELLDLKPGMVVPPLEPLALMNVAGKFVLQTRVRQDVKAGQRIEVEIPGRSRVPAVVDSCENGRLLAHLTIPSRAPATSGKVQVLF